MLPRIAPQIAKHTLFAVSTAVAYVSFKPCQDNALRYKMKYWSRCDKPDHPLCPAGTEINQLFQDRGWKNPTYYTFDTANAHSGYAENIGFANSHTFIAGEYKNPAAYVIINSAFKGDTYDLDPELYKEIVNDASHLLNNDLLHRRMLKGFSLYFSAYFSLLLIKKTNLHHHWLKPFNVNDAVFNKWPKSYYLGFMLAGFPFAYIGFSLYGYTKLITSAAEIATLPLIHYQNKQTEPAITDAVSTYTNKYNNKDRSNIRTVRFFVSFGDDDEPTQAVNTSEENQSRLSK